MPIYEYKCATCGHVFEDMILSAKDPGPSKCPKCEATEVSRLISGTNFQLKGGGWFHSDYGKPGKSAPAGSGTDASTPAEAASTPSDTASASSSSSD